MPEPAMPQPRLLRALCRQAHRLLDLKVQQKQPVLRPCDLGQQPPVLVTDPQHSALDHHLCAALVQLPEADDACLQLWDPVDIRQRPVFPVPTPEQDSATAADCHPGAIAELDAPGGFFIKLGENSAASCHMVARA